MRFAETGGEVLGRRPVAGPQLRHRDRDVVLPRPASITVLALTTRFREPKATTARRA